MIVQDEATKETIEKVNVIENRGRQKIFFETKQNPSAANFLWNQGSQEPDHLCWRTVQRKKALSFAWRRVFLKQRVLNVIVCAQPTGHSRYFLHIKQSETLISFSFLTSPHSFLRPNAHAQLTQAPHGGEMRKTIGLPLSIKAEIHGRYWDRTASNSWAPSGWFRLKATVWWWTKLHTEIHILPSVLELLGLIRQQRKQRAWFEPLRLYLLFCKKSILYPPNQCFSSSSTCRR